MRLRQSLAGSGEDLEAWTVRSQPSHILAQCSLAQAPSLGSGRLPEGSFGSPQGDNVGHFRARMALRLKERAFDQLLICDGPLRTTTR